jgi:polysaccharide biosynthesis/export protein
MSLNSIGRFLPIRLRAGTRSLAACLLLLSCCCSVAQQGGTPSSGGSVGAIPGSVPAQAPASSTVTSAAPSGVPIANPILLYPGEDFRIGVGDLLSVSVYLAPDFLRTVRVGIDGTVQLPLIGAVHVRGLSVRDAQRAIADQLRTAGMFARPDVLIQVLDTVNGTVSITGEMRATVPVTSERTLRDVLLTAGGLPPSASHTIKIVRPGVNEPITVRLGPDLATSASANIPVYPHDIIQISRAGVVFVIGAFRSQGAVPLDQAQPLTLMQLAALSGGVGFEGKYNDLRLIRTEGTERKVVEIDIKKVLNGKAPDPILQANDIVFLPTDNFKAILKSLGVGGVLGLVSLALSLHNY